MNRRRFLRAVAGMAAAPAVWPAVTGAVNALDAIRGATGAGMADIWRDPRFELQVIYTRIDRRPGAAPQLTHIRHGVVPERWFAPASLVKLPVAALALERVAEFAQRGVGRDSLIVQRGQPRCWPRTTLQPESVARSIRRMFVASENEPFNRLYDLLGQDRIHARLSDMGCPMSRIIARIAPCSPAENRASGMSEFVDARREVLARVDAATTVEVRAFPHGRAHKGRAWVDGRKTIPGPHDFSDSNFMPLDEAHAMLMAIVMPEAVAPARRFRLDAAAHQYLRQCMGMLPAECADPLYDERAYPPSHAKYLVGGGGAQALPAGVRSFNKVGRSFGYLADCAYVCDTTRGAEFFLSASLYVNEDDVLNDGRYEYRETGLPFLAALGRAVLEVDAARTRAHPYLPLGADGRFSA